MFVVAFAGHICRRSLGAVMGRHRLVNCCGLLRCTFWRLCKLSRAIGPRNDIATPRLCVFSDLSLIWVSGVAFDNRIHALGNAFLRIRLSFLCSRVVGAISINSKARGNVHGGFRHRFRIVFCICFALVLCYVKYLRFVFCLFVARQLHPKKGIST